MGKLTALSVRSLQCPSNSRRPVRFGDGDGLYLQVAPGNTKSWLFRFTLHGKAREMGLGPVGEPPGGVPLAEARKLAAAARASSPGRARPDCRAAGTQGRTAPDSAGSGGTHLQGGGRGAG